MVEILRSGLKVAKELAMLEEKESKRLITKGAKFFEEAASKAKLSEKERLDAIEPFYKEIIHHFTNGRTGKKFNFISFVHGGLLLKRNIPMGKVIAINGMAKEHAKEIHALGEMVAKKYGKIK
ncbi:hypothetical protein HY989_03990 [Candidatus Micrarchaeota archaeon]|nr:hypothetical protein [Candidatus Micrarchaeota archaeon]